MTNYDQFIKDTWGIPGVYRITNIFNSRCYIGEGGNIGARTWGHISGLLGNWHKVKAFQEDWDKYGSAGFKFELVVETVDPNMRLKQEEELQLEYRDKLYSTFLRGQIVGRKSPITDEQLTEIKKLKASRLSWSKLAKVANLRFGYTYSGAWYALQVQKSEGRCPPSFQSEHRAKTRSRRRDE